MIRLIRISSHYFLMLLGDVLVLELGSGNDYLRGKSPKE